MKIIKVLVAAFSLSLTLLTSGTVPAQAETVGTRLFWIAETVESSYRGIFTAVVNSTRTGFIDAPVRLTADTAAGAVSTALATDGTHLYFADNIDDNDEYDIVRTDLDGGNRTVLVESSDWLRDLDVVGNHLYYVTYYGGVYTASATTLSTPSLLFGWQQNADYSGQSPTYAYQKAEMFNGSLLLHTDTGLFKMNVNFGTGTASNVVLMDSDWGTYTDWSVAEMELDETANKLYFVENYRFHTTSDLTVAARNWPLFEATYSDGGHGTRDLVFHRGFMYQMSPDSALYSVELTGQKRARNLFTGPWLNSDYSLQAIAAVDAALPDEAGLANTGIDPTLAFVGLGLLGVGVYLRQLAK